MRNLFIFLVLITSYSWSQTLVINELDADNPSTDTEEFIEIKSMTPNFSTNGFVLVFFNGSINGGNTSYLAYSLNGYTTDSNGLLVLGSTNVTPFPQVLIPESVIQNGADAVAIYQASLSDFPGGTLATQTNLIDALVYDTNDADDLDLMQLLGETVQYNDNGTTANPKSLQRQNDGTYLAATPTPRQLNDGSGIIFKAITISTTQTQYNEGDNFDITFTSSETLDQDVTFNIDLSNSGFTSSDYSGTTTLTILNGQDSVTTTITLTDDADDEGDEELKIKFLDLVEPVVASNNFVTIRVVDNDFTTAAWAIPTQPDLNVVTSTQPVGYYDSLNDLSDVALRQAIASIIADPTVVRAQTYADVFDILLEADQNPANSNEVWLVYSEEGRPKLDVQTGRSSAGKWNREHTFPRSRAGYESIDDDDFADGINTFWTTSIDSLRHGNSDAHALRAADASENSSRGNKHYGIGEYVGPSGNLGSFKGDVARGVLFLELRYNGLEIVNGFPTTEGQLGDLATLLQWHEDDPPDDFERNRNNIIYEWQKNRNPLIDMPLLVDYIWGDKVGQLWNNAFSTEDFQDFDIKVFPNPTTGKLILEGINLPTQVSITTIDGRALESFTLIDSNVINLDLTSGVYLLQISQNDKIQTQKIIIR